MTVRKLTILLADDNGFPVEHIGTLRASTNRSIHIHAGLALNPCTQAQLEALVRDFEAVVDCYFELANTDRIAPSLVMRVGAGGVYLREDPTNQIFSAAQELLAGLPPRILEGRYRALQPLAARVSAGYLVSMPDAQNPFANVLAGGSVLYENRELIRAALDERSGNPPKPL